MGGASNEPTPKPSELALALTILLALVAAIVVQTGGVDAAADDGADFYMFMRKRVGYFSRYDLSSPFSKIYTDYFANVIQKTDRAMLAAQTNDWRRVRPTGELCVDFLTGLKVKLYVMNRPYEVIVLDACLDWLFNDSDGVLTSERETDRSRLDVGRKQSMDLLAKDSRLRQIYQSTGFATPDAQTSASSLPDKLKMDIYEYLMRLLKVFSDNPTNGCHSLWLAAYNDFIDEIYVGECEDEAQCKFYNTDGAAQDSYLQMIAESTRAASLSCYDVMQNQMRGLMDDEFEVSYSGATGLKGRLAKKNLVTRQIEKERWAREMVSILQLASGISQDSPVNLGDVVEALDNIKNSDADTISRFTKALSDYAVDNFDVKKSENDPSGRARFGRAMTKLCRPYIDMQLFLSTTGGIVTEGDGTERKPFEFYSLIYSLVRITNHELIFGIKKSDFEQHVIKNRWEALYLATFACQIISTTWAELTYDANRPTFNVLLRPNADIMIADWPLELLRTQLPIIYPKLSKRQSGTERRPSDSSSHSSFGRNFRLMFRDKDKRPEEQEQEQEQTSLPPSTEVQPRPVGLTQILEQPNRPLGPVTYQAPSAARVLEVRPKVVPAASLIQPRSDTKIMSIESIKMFKDLHGHYPRSLPANYKEIYPELPDDLSGTYPKQSQPFQMGFKPNPSSTPPAKQTKKPKLDINLLSQFNL